MVQATLDTFMFKDMKDFINISSNNFLTCNMNISICYRKSYKVLVASKWYKINTNVVSKRIEVTQIVYQLCE
jgi:hypothetical protein